MEEIMSYQLLNAKNSENGRSMIEMLGVLAIIAVLSVGGIAGYSKAMDKFKMEAASEVGVDLKEGYNGPQSLLT